MLNTPTTVEFAQLIRKRALNLVHRAKASHIGGALSMADLLAVLYGGRVLKIDPQNPRSENRDRFLLSKGHACTGLYATLNLMGILSDELMESYAQNGSILTSHVSASVPGIELSTGSLGHALSVGCGMALAAVRKKSPWRVFVLLSDGELDEGSNWEAFLFAGHHKLSRLTAIIDYNKIQSLGNTAEVLRLDPLDEKAKAFGWHVVEIDGHNHAAIASAFEQAKAIEDRPTLIIAHTVKGKGVSFMENNLLWHYRPPSDEELQKALQELA
jgi:transketolase